MGALLLVGGCKKDGADVFINGTKVDGYYLVNGGVVNGIDLRYEIADVPLDVGEEPTVFVATSDEEFGLSLLGYTPGSAYAYPGGMALREIGPDE